MYARSWGGGGVGGSQMKVLVRNYRNHPVIMSLAAELFYGGDLPRVMYGNFTYLFIANILFIAIPSALTSQMYWFAGCCLMEVT